MLAAQVQTETVIATACLDQAAMIIDRSTLIWAGIEDDEERSVPAPIWWDAHLRAQ